MPETQRANAGNDTFLDTVRAMADRLGLTDEERDRYVHEHMTRSGYRMVPNYVLDEPEKDKGKGDFFGLGGSNGKSTGDTKKSGGWFPQ